MFPLLLADIGEIIGALMPVVIFIIWVISQIANRVQQAPAKPVRGPGQPRPAPAAFDDDEEEDEDDFVVAAPQARGGGNKGLFNEIEQFLARARQQMQQQAGGQVPGAPVITQQVRPAQPAAPQPHTLSDLRATPIRPAISGEGGTAGNLGRRREVDAHVREHLSTASIERRIEQLGDAVEIADDLMEQHLQEKFDHRVGTLASSEPEKPAPAAAKAKAQAAAPIGFAALLASTDDVRQAIVLNEVLTRPTDRW